MIKEPSVTSCPPEAIAEAHKLKFPPAARVPTDEDLMSGVAEPLPMHQWYLADAAADMAVPDRVMDGHGAPDGGDTPSPSGEDPGEDECAGSSSASASSSSSDSNSS